MPSLLQLKQQGKASTLKNLMSFDPVSPDHVKAGQKVGLQILYISDVIEVGSKQPEQKFREPQPEDVYMFCYTSGTTGSPKAVQLTHRNILSVSTAANYAGVEVVPEDTVISYLPLAHSFEKVLFVLCILKGVRIGYYSGDVLKLTNDCIVLQPTFFPSVPRLYNKIYDKINSKLAELYGVRAYLANRAISSKLYYLRKDGTLNYAFYDKVVCSKFKAVLGGKIRFMATGSAPISVDVLNFLKIAFCCPLVEGYG